MPLKAVGDFEIVFILLTKMVIFYVQSTIVKIGFLRLEKPAFIGIIPKICLVISSLFNTSFNKLPEQHIDRS